MILKWDVAGALLEYDIVFNVGRSKTVVLLCNVFVAVVLGVCGHFWGRIFGFFPCLQVRL